jgi:drug/metabolite transporter (DMT)-like permease
MMARMEVALALGAALAWGVADFGSGMKSRSLSAVLVTLIVFAVGGTGSLLVAAASESPPTARTAGLAVLAGAVTGVGVTVFFHALAIGEIGVVATIVAGGTGVPVVVGLARGERPGVIALAGVVAVALGVVAMVYAPRSAASLARDPHRALVLAVVASVALGLYYVVARAGSSGRPLWFAGLGQLCAAVPLVVLAAARRPRAPGRRDLRDVVALGLANGAGWLLSVLALGHGLLAVVSVLIALYPAITITLALVFAGERLTRHQYLAGLAILAGVGLIAGG